MSVTVDSIRLQLAFQRLEFDTGFDVNALIDERNRYKAALELIASVCWDGPVRELAVTLAEEALA